MKKDKIFTWLSVTAILIGLGMAFGYSLANGTSNTPLWIALILIVLGAVLMGMAISTKANTKPIIPTEIVDNK